MLEAKNIAAFRAERLVFRNLTFAVAQGGAVVLRGPNGAGKSSVLRTLAGFLPLAAGEIRIGGEITLEDLPGHARLVAYLGHQDAVKPGLTGAENLRFAGLARGAADAALARFGLEALAGLPARLYSAGQKRRLALARIAASGATIWLLDEPATGLDAAANARLETAMAQHRAAGGIVVATTHVPLDLPDAQTIVLA